MPPKAKQKNTANRHESGLAKGAPGKRITKQRSNNHLPSTNGQAAHSIPATTTDGLNDHDTADDSPASLPDDDMVAATTASSTPPVTAAPSESSRRVSDATAYSSAVNTSKLVGRSASSSFSMAMTILSACPLSDAIAILILLMSLPPALIMLIHSLFASLTFVPPTAGVSLSSWNGMPPLGDWFHGSASGGPSLFTILFSDGIMSVVYLASSYWLQNIYLDLGQAVVAISLSGATAAKDGSANSVAACSMLVVFSHFLRYNKIHLISLEYLRSLLQNLGIGQHWDPISSADFSSSPYVAYGWYRAILGCHILAQGVLTLGRRYLHSYSNQSRASANKKQDPEAASYGDGPKSSTSPGDSGQEPAGGLGSDGRPPGPSSAMRDGNQRIITSKKKKKHATQVRSRQPLWAAIASTKVTFLKEMEQKQASEDQAEASAHDTTNENQLLPRISTEDRISIVDIRPADILFRAHLPSFSATSRPKLDPNAPISAGIDKSKPFFVRMNGADWGSTKISEEGEGADTVWHGEIFGLTPLTNYSCELVNMSDHSVLCTTSLVTLPAPSTEQTSIVTAPPQPQSLRPLSPISTLKQSIAAAEMKREDARNKLKRARRDHKNAASAVRKEIDQLNAKVASSGGQDERQRQRILQLTQHLRQANEATTALKEETDALGEIPQAELREYNEKKRAWQAACDKKSAAMADLEAAKTQAQREIAQVTSELTSAAQKRERLSTRKGKLTEQLDRLTNQKNADMSARQKHEQERANRVSEYQRQEANLLYWTQQSNKDAEDCTLRANEFFTQIEYLTNVVAHQQQTLSGPPTPEGNLPGTNGPPSRQPTAFDFNMFGGGFGQGFGGLSNGGVTQVRGRSSSMLSGYSGFTDDDLDTLAGAESAQNEALLLENDKGKGRLASPIGSK
ncbi:MAG: Uncharacterized protein AUREO_055240 [Aureobasidium pullulans]|nr:MAG: Uncharacterized protein AUREO_055240 [Aureobasidium pullulans]